MRVEIPLPECCSKLNLRPKDHQLAFMRYRDRPSSRHNTCPVFVRRPNREFWLSLGVVCDDKVAKAKELLGETEEGVATGGLHKVSDYRRRQGCYTLPTGIECVHSTCLPRKGNSRDKLTTSMVARSAVYCTRFALQTVIDDVTAKFENRSVEELAEQKIKIQDMLDSGKASVDSEFWEAVLKELHVFQVKPCFSLYNFLDPFRFRVCLKCYRSLVLFRLTTR